MNINLRALVTLATFISVVFGLPAANAEQTKLKVGVLVPLTGEGASVYGDQIRKAISIAQSESKDSGFELVYEDSKCQGQVAVTTAKKLIQQNNIKYLIGDVCWTDLIAPVTEAGKVIVISTGSAQSTVRDAGDFVFRLKLDVAIDSRAFAREVFPLLANHTAGVIYAQDQWGEGVAHNFSDEFRTIGGTITAEAGFQQGTTDFKTLLLKFKKSAPDLLMIIAYPSQVGIIARQARQLGVSSRFGAYGGDIGDETVQLAGAALEGLLFMDEWDDHSSSHIVKNFLNKFQERFGSPPNLFGAMGYDAFRLVEKLVAKCGADTVCARDELYAIKNFPGATGDLSFDDHGDVSKAVILKEVHDGRFKKVKSGR